jgi:hypothetical protein
MWHHPRTILELLRDNPKFLLKMLEGRVDIHITDTELP